MYLCYIDESGTPEVPGTSSHFILLGIAIPIDKWKDYETSIVKIKEKYELAGKEIHTAFMLRRFVEQDKIPDFEKLSYKKRRIEVNQQRAKYLIQLNSSGKSKKLNRIKRDYNKNEDYVHLTLKEREDFITEVAKQIGRWVKARVFAECIDKAHYNQAKSQYSSINHQAFEQLVSRFETYLKITTKNLGHKQFGLLIHDNNQTVERKHTEMMTRYQETGTLWTSINGIIETPLFVDSKLTSMIQIADLCSFALRRYLERSEDKMYNEVIKRADKKEERMVGVRHFTHSSCTCNMCSNH